MFCGNCGKQIDDNANVCPYCGDTTAAAATISDDTAQSICKKFFISPNERYITSLGDGYLKNFLTTGNIKRCVAVLSDKRIYLRGNIIDCSSSKFEKVNVEKIVNVEDVTGTGFIYSSSQIWKLILAILTIPLVIPAIIFFVLYIIGRKTIFCIEYAGGYIKFDASIYSPFEVHEFQKRVRIAQDELKGLL